MKTKLFALTALASAVASASETLPLEVTVTASRTADQKITDTYTYDVYDVQSDDNITDIVSSTGGVTLVQNGPVGQSSSTFIRGTDSNHTLVTYNGIAIRDESTISGATDISQHSTVGIDSVQIVKGPMGSTYGPNAVAGVINIDSVITDESFIQQELGSNNTRGTRVKVGQRFDKTTVSFDGEFKSTDGISVYADGTEDDGFDSRNYFIGQDTYFSNGWNLLTTYTVNDNSADLDSSSADILDYTSDWKWKNFHVSTTDGYTKVAYNKSTHDRQYEQSGSLDVYTSTTDTLLAQHTLLKSNYSVTVGTEYTKSAATIDTTTNFWQASVDEDRINRAVFVNGAYSLTEEVTVTGGYRYDANSKFTDQQTTRLGLSGYGFRGSVTNGYRLPTFYEMYGSDNFGFTGNPNVNPETSVSYEVGYGNDWFDLALFEIRTTDALAYTYDASTFTSTYQNDDSEQKSRGAELTIKTEYKDVDIANTTSYTLSRDGNGDEKLRRPMWTNTTTVGTNINTVYTYAQVAYVGKYQDIDGTTYTNFEADDVVTANIGAKYDITEALSINATLNNIGDVQYERPSGYNQNGRNAMVRLEYEF